jgi:hypothetical protein
VQSLRASGAAVAESDHRRAQVIEDRHLILAADDLERGVDGGSVARAGIFALGCALWLVRSRHSILFVPTCLLRTLGDVASVNFLTIARSDAG